MVDRTQRGGKPLVTITAREIPIDKRLVAAIPGYYDAQSDDPDDISLRIHGFAAGVGASFAIFKGSEEHL